MFWTSLHEKAKAGLFPLRVMFELTYRCNFRCRHCYVPPVYKKKPELKTKEVYSILDQLKSLGCLYLGFTGGEPFLRKDIFSILSYARKKGFEVLIYSNGSLIDKKAAGILSDLRINKVDITIPSLDLATFERISGMPGSHHMVFDAIDLLRKNKIPLGFKTSLVNENRLEARDIRRFALSLGAQHRLNDMLFPRLDGDKKPYEYMPQAKGNRVCDPRSKKAGRTPRTDHLFFCGAGKTQAAITPAGELKMCLMIDQPRYAIRGLSLAKCWKKLNDFVLALEKKNLHPCGACDLSDHCSWCPARSWLENKTYSQCVIKH